MKNFPEKDDDVLLGRILGFLRTNEPRLKDNQEIPQNVMRSIQYQQSGNPPDGFTGSFRIRYLNYAQRFLTAASVCLLILYGAEEFLVVKKMNALEQHTASVRTEPANTIARRLSKSGLPVASLYQRFPDRLQFFAAKQYLSQNQDIESLKSLSHEN